MTKVRSESRFGFGQLAASVGALLLAIGVAQPWLKLDAARALRAALKPEDLDQTVASQMVTTLTSAPIEQLRGAPETLQLGAQLGIAASGWEQNHALAAALLAAALLSLIAVVRSVTAKSAWAARSQSPLLALSGLVALAVAAAALWLVAPQPRIAMRPDLGLWLVTGGGILLLLGALTLGSNRRRPWIDEFEDHIPMKAFDNTEHLAYSHGAWVPRRSEDN